MERDNISERGNVRVSVYFPVRFRLPSDPDHLADLITSHRTCDRFGAPPSAFSDMPSDLTDLTEFQETSPHLFSMWMSLERKIDHLIWMTHKETFEDRDMEQGVCIDMSAGGACIQTDRALAPGNTIHMRMSPPTFPVFLIETLGVVISSHRNERDKGKWSTRVEFTAINKSDQEDLITYIFKRQREILRDTSD